MYPLTSIVMLTLNELTYTQKCIDSIERLTPEAYELIVVDNGSTDGTVEYLRSKPGIVVISNGENRGFGGGCNQGIAIARGERIMLLNNDTVVTAGWLTAMHRALDADPRRGIVGPRSNRVADTQCIQDVDYDVWSLDGLEQFAAGWTRDHDRGGHGHNRLIGFCMLIRREVLNDIGGFDVRFGLGNFEDDDLCLRAGVAGWSCWVCDDSFVHHFGSRTFAGTGIDYQQSMATNWARFAVKWNLPAATVDGSLGYDPNAMLASTSYSPDAHYAPLVSRAFDDERAVIDEHRGTRLLVLADRRDEPATHAAFTTVLNQFGDSDPVTVVIRIDEADTCSAGVLNEIADEIEARGGTLPDIVVLEGSDANDQAVIAACDTVVTFGDTEWAIAGFARHLSRNVVSEADLRADRVDIVADAA